MQALIHGLHGAATATAIVLPLAVSAVALTAGLAVATFVKAFGTGFLARPRSAGAAAAHESPASMLAGMGLAGAACAVLALVPGAVLPAIGRAVAAAGAAFPASAGAGGAVTLRLDGLAGEVSPLLLTLALLIVMVPWPPGCALACRCHRSAIGQASGLRVVPAPDTAARRAGAARLWDCGGGPLTARMEYTATSFAEPLQRVFDDVLAPETDLDVTHLDEAALPGRARSSTGAGCPTGSSAASTSRCSPRSARGATPRGGWRPAACTATSATASTRSPAC